MTEILTNKDFIALVQDSVNKIVDAINNKTGVEKAKYECFEQNRKVFLWQRFILSIALMGILTGSFVYKWMPEGAVITLLTGVVASLFITPKKD